MYLLGINSIFNNSLVFIGICLFRQLPSISGFPFGFNTKYCPVNLSKILSKLSSKVQNQKIEERTNFAGNWAKINAKSAPEVNSAINSRNLEVFRGYESCDSPLFFYCIIFQHISHDKPKTQEK